MTNIRKELVSYLKENYVIGGIEIINKQEDKDVSKYLFKLLDNQKIEAVYMHHDYGHSL
jgi:adenine C2-methylase RlmN of 23S rRNA A2503 and tRNA A37